MKLSARIWGLLQQWNLPTKLLKMNHNIKSQQEHYHSMLKIFKQSEKEAKPQKLFIIILMQKIDKR